MAGRPLARLRRNGPEYPVLPLDYVSKGHSVVAPCAFDGAPMGAGQNMVIMTPRRTLRALIKAGYGHLSPRMLLLFEGTGSAAEKEWYRLKDQSSKRHGPAMLDMFYMPYCADRGVQVQYTFVLVQPGYKGRGLQLSTDITFPARMREDVHHCVRAGQVPLLICQSYMVHNAMSFAEGWRPTLEEVCSEDPSPRGILNGLRMALLMDPTLSEHFSTASTRIGFPPLMDAIEEAL